jgi:hypothetical protein
MWTEHGEGVTVLAFHERADCVCVERHACRGAVAAAVCTLRFYGAAPPDAREADSRLDEFVPGHLVAAGPVTRNASAEPVFFWQSLMAIAM